MQYIYCAVYIPLLSRLRLFWLFSILILHFFGILHSTQLYNLLALSWVTQFVSVYLSVCLFYCSCYHYWFVWLILIRSLERVIVITSSHLTVRIRHGLGLGQSMKSRTSYRQHYESRLPNGLKLYPVDHCWAGPWYRRWRTHRVKDINV